MATITSISPTSGVPAGGTSVTVTGTGFKNGGASSVVSDVLFGTVAGTGVSVSSDTSLTVTSPAGTGTVDVIVKVESVVVGADSFTYGTVSPFVQKADSGTPAGNNTTKTTGSITQTQGNANIVLVSFGSSTASSFTVPTVTVTDTQSNTYVKAADFVQTQIGATTTSLGVMAFYCPSIVTGSNAVTATLGTSMAYLNVIVAEYQHAGGGVEVAVAATSTSSSSMAASLTTLTANALVLGLFASKDGTNTAGAGFTSRDSYDKVILEEVNTLAVTPGAVSVPATSGGTNGWAGIGLSIKRT